MKILVVKNYCQLASLEDMLLVDYSYLISFEQYGLKVFSVIDTNQKNTTHKTIKLLQNIFPLYNYNQSLNRACYILEKRPDPKPITPYETFVVDSPFSDSSITTSVRKGSPIGKKVDNNIQQIYIDYLKVWNKKEATNKLVFINHKNKIYTESKGKLLLSNSIINDDIVGVFIEMKGENIISHLLRQTPSQDFSDHTTTNQLFFNSNIISKDVGRCAQDNIYDFESIHQTSDKFLDNAIPHSTQNYTLLTYRPFDQLEGLRFFNQELEYKSKTMTATKTSIIPTVPKTTPQFSDQLEIDIDTLLLNDLDELLADMGNRTQQKLDTYDKELVMSSKAFESFELHVPGFLEGQCTRFDKYMASIANDGFLELEGDMGFEEDISLQIPFMSTVWNRTELSIYTDLMNVEKVINEADAVYHSKNIKKGMKFSWEK